MGFLDFYNLLPKLGSLELELRCFMSLVQVDPEGTPLLQKNQFFSLDLIHVSGKVRV